MKIKEFSIELRNCVSTGGGVVLSKGNSGEVSIVLTGGDPNRKDCRVLIEELMKAAKLIEAGVFED